MPDADKRKRIETMTPAELAEDLQVSLRTLRRWTVAGILPQPCRLGGTTRYMVGDVLARLGNQPPDGSGGTRPLA